MGVIAGARSRDTIEVMSAEAGRCRRRPPEERTRIIDGALPIERCHRVKMECHRTRSPSRGPPEQSLSDAWPKSFLRLQGANR